MPTIRHAYNPHEPVMIPRRLCKDSCLTGDSKAVYLYIASTDPGEELTIAKIEDALGLDEYSVADSIKELNSSGFIKLLVTDDEP